MASKPQNPKNLQSAEEYLWGATRAKDTATKLSLAQLGLAAAPDSVDPQTRFLLLRQLYLVQLELEKLGQARRLSDEMVDLGVMRDTAYHDRSRVLFLLGEYAAAVDAQRQAARSAPAIRRSFHFWSLATMQQQSGDLKGAAGSLEHGLRWAKRDRALLEAHHALVLLEDGLAVPSLAAVIQRLAQSPNRDGYGRYVLGMLYSHMGDQANAVVHLRAFLNRNASIDRAKALTLRRELEDARRVVAARAS